jgi:hypothetical protein
MKNCALAESGSPRRAIASVPRSFFKPLRLSSGIVPRVGFSFRSAV